MPKISIIIPVYNMEKYIAHCLDSVLVQSFSDLEIICINDASKDLSLKILQEYAQKDERIIIINCPQNIGVAAARNLALEQAKGEYVAFCDADDAYTVNAIEILYTAAKNSNSPISCGNVISIDESFSYFLGASDVTMCTWFLKREIVTVREYAPLWLPSVHPRFFFSKKFLLDNNIKYAPLMRGEDPPFLAKAFCLAEQIAVCPEVVYIRREVRTKGKKVAMQQAFVDYVKNIELCYNIFKEHGFMQQAFLYKAFTMKETLELREWLNYTREHKILLRNELNRLLTMDKEEFLNCNFAPYNLNAVNIANAVKNLKLPLCIVTFLRIWAFFKTKLLKR